MGNKYFNKLIKSTASVQKTDRLKSVFPEVLDGASFASVTKEVAKKYQAQYTPKEWELLQKQLTDK